MDFTPTLLQMDSAMARVHGCGLRCPPLLTRTIFCLFRAQGRVMTTYRYVPGTVETQNPETVVLTTKT